ncbi:hypothetical protein IE53DRAFT_387996 [Violaceomyces palustris]|uniref:Uncharacterized protein n=1 Tax=Violaceomyces palustris TaxID=1673888 RepID=A0ACD0NVK4_9BASI|nr:hypothetical protein IE53DRAFT_387996 [Violaceomyces palustris]
MYCLRWWIPLFLLPFPSTTPFLLTLFLLSYSLHTKPCVYCSFILVGLFASSTYWYPTSHQLDTNILRSPPGISPYSFRESHWMKEEEDLIEFFSKIKLRNLTEIQISSGLDSWEGNGEKEEEEEIERLFDDLIQEDEGNGKGRRFKEEDVRSWIEMRKELKRLELLTSFCPTPQEEEDGEVQPWRNRMEATPRLEDRRAPREFQELKRDYFQRAVSKRILTDRFVYFLKLRLLFQGWDQHLVLKRGEVGEVGEEFLEVGEDLEPYLKGRDNEDDGPSLKLRLLALGRTMDGVDEGRIKRRSEGEIDDGRRSQSWIDFGLGPTGRGFWRNIKRSEPEEVGQVDKSAEVGYRSIPSKDLGWGEKVESMRRRRRRERGKATNLKTLEIVLCPPSGRRSESDRRGEEDRPADERRADRGSRGEPKKRFFLGFKGQGGLGVWVNLDWSSSSTATKVPSSNDPTRSSKPSLQVPDSYRPPSQDVPETLPSVIHSEL